MDTVKYVKQLFCSVNKTNQHKTELTKKKMFFIKTLVSKKKNMMKSLEAQHVMNEKKKKIIDEIQP